MANLHGSTSVPSAPIVAVIAASVAVVIGAITLSPRTVPAAADTRAVSSVATRGGPERDIGLMDLRLSSVWLTRSAVDEIDGDRDIGIMDFAHR